MKEKYRVWKTFYVREQDLKTASIQTDNEGWFTFFDAWPTNIWLRFDPLKPDWQERVLKLLSKRVYSRYPKVSPWGLEKGPRFGGSIRLNVDSNQDVYVSHNGVPDFYLSQVQSRRAKRKFRRESPELWTLMENLKKAFDTPIQRQPK